MDIWFALSRAAIRYVLLDSITDIVDFRYWNSISLITGTITMDLIPVAMLIYVKKRAYSSGRFATGRSIDEIVFPSQDQMGHFSY